jgi:hypothetical protein
MAGQLLKFLARTQKTDRKNYSSYGLVIFSEAAVFVKLPGNKILIEMASLLRQKKSSCVIISDKIFDSKFFPRFIEFFHQKLYNNF